MADSQTLVAVVFLVLLTGWLGSLTYTVFKLKNHYNNLTKNVAKKGLQEIVEEVLHQSRQNQDTMQKLQKKAQELQEQLHKALQVISIIRYNPFSNTGGDQSFILGLFDKDKSGVVISSLSNRSNTRWFAKPVKNGKSVDVPLTKEEEETIAKANQ